MNVEINQTLHGYNNGHQLLASSTSLDSVDGKTLLFQTDLSGPNIISGFEEYVAGYPLNNLGFYALSKTWYAPEMNRPGCVWTHTLLISYGDLGKMDDLSQLLRYFKRPVISKYSDYTQTILLDYVNDSERTTNYSNNHYFEKQISTLLYTYPDSPIILPNSNSSTFDKILLNIWSNQWPRLRRNFLFCTGSLSLRHLDGRIFDIQVVPQKISGQLKRQNTELVFFSQDIPVDPMIEGADSMESHELRNFLWTFGSDIEGNRVNYLSLIKIIVRLSNAQTISELVNSLLQLFPKHRDASLLKSSIFAIGSGLTSKFKEIDVLRYLTTTSDTILSHFDIEQSIITERVLSLFSRGQIKFSELAIFWESALPNRIDGNIWKSITISTKERLQLIYTHPSLTLPLIEQHNEILTLTDFWLKKGKHQRISLDFIINSGKRIPDPLIHALLQSENEIIFTLSDNYRYIPSIIFDWLNKNNLPINLNFQSRIINQNIHEFKTWLKQAKEINERIYRLIFETLEPNVIQKLDAPAKIWLQCVNNYSNNSHSKYSLCVILSIGLLDRISNPHLLIEVTFERVYSLAQKSELNNDFWKIVPREDNMNEEDEDSGFWSIFNMGFRKKKEKVPYWDYCESLIRIASANFVKNRWPKKSFIMTFKRKDIFERTTYYLLGFKKGQQYLEALLEDSQSGREILSPQQQQFINQFLDTK